MFARLLPFYVCPEYRKKVLVKALLIHANSKKEGAAVRVEIPRRVGSPVRVEAYKSNPVTRKSPVKVRK